ncbi:unnamed protein product [Bathycoccus prasinos]
MEEEELKRAFERCVESSRPLPPLAVKGRDVLDDDDNLAALKEREDAEKAGEYLESLMMKEDDFDGKKKARRCAEMLGPVDAFGREMPFKLEFCMILLLEEEEELGMVEKLTRLARKCEVQLGDSSASASASSASTTYALTNICACYDISPSDASAKMAFFRFVKSNCGANEKIGNFILKKQQQQQQQQQTVAANY